MIRFRGPSLTGAPPLLSLIVRRWEASAVEALRQYERVRVRQLLQPPEAYNGWGANQRPPRVGDVGYLVDILHTTGVPDSYVVEASGPSGVTIWLGDFAASELEPVG